MRILVVDDELEMAEMIGDALTERGYSAIVLRSGAEAVRCLEQGLFDALVTDLRMPGINGIELLRASRALDPSMPVIIMTAYGAIDTALDAANEGAFRYLMKPFRLARLVELLETAWSARDTET